MLFDPLAQTFIQKDPEDKTPEKEVRSCLGCGWCEDSQSLYCRKCGQKLRIVIVMCNECLNRIYYTDGQYCVFCGGMLSHKRDPEEYRTCQPRKAGG